jgi:hypothetical protein
MSPTLDHLLTLVGRLDDAPGYDAPRERFRRFLVEHVRTAADARALIEQCQQSPLEQHRRALQDLIVLLGRLLGFETTFGTYLPVAGAVKLDGQWQARGRLQMVVEVRSDPVAVVAEDSLLRSVAALAALAGPDSPPPAGICVIGPACAGRHRLEEALTAAQPSFPVAVVALSSLLALTDMVQAGGMTTDDVARLFESKAAADFIVDLIARNAATVAPARPRAGDPEAPPALPVLSEPAHWIASVVSDHATRPEEFLELVVGRRQIFGISAADTSVVVGRHDWLVFYVAGKGVVGRARVVSLADHASIRQAHRFRQLLNVEDVRLHLSSPVAVDAETELRLRAAAAPGGRPSQALIRIPREQFAALTGSVRRASEATAPRSRARD